MSHVTVAVGLVASLLGTPAPALTTQSIVSATATCGPGQVVIAGGGEVDYGPAGGGGVALTGITPHPDGSAVTVTAAAPPGRAANWSLIAHVKCNQSQPLLRVVEHGIGTATAECPAPDTKVFGLGFRVEGGLVTEVGLDAALSRVRVTAGDSAQVTAIALCKTPAQMQRVRRTSTTTGWPKTASGQDNDPDLEAYAVGATVTGPPNATLDALVPGPDGGTTWARGTLFGPSGQQQRAAADDEGDGEVVMEAAAIGTFH